MSEATSLHEEILETETDDGPMAVLRKRPSEGAAPRVAMFHDGPGIRKATHAFMQKLAASGYDVICPDLYHRAGRLIGIEPEQRAADPGLGAKMWELIQAMTDDGIQHDMDVALAAVGVTDDEPVGAIGFCLGARAVYRMLERRPQQCRAGAMWHPSFLADDEPDSPHLTAGGLRQPLFIGIGDADQTQSIEMHQRFFDAVESLEHVTVEVFAGADHGFTWPGYDSYHQEASDRCFAATTELFAGALR
ncbi:MAG: hydrolase [Acidimicrobiales bacterium]|nr:hydrolase [Acidimicrobiales bacterium]